MDATRGSTASSAIAAAPVRAASPLSDSDEPGAITVGVAISVPPPWAEILDGVRASSGDPLAAFIPAHLTLLGPTDIDAGQLGDVESRLAVVAAAQAPFAIHLRGTGTFRPVTEVVFVTVAAGISECEMLATDVRRGPLRRQLSYPYHPHVTIAHDVPTDALDRVYAELADFEALFTADHFTLYVHGADGHWRPIRDFKLSGEPIATPPAIAVPAVPSTTKRAAAPAAKRATATTRAPRKTSSTATSAATKSAATKEASARTTGKKAAAAKAAAAKAGTSTAASPKAGTKRSRAATAAKTSAAKTSAAKTGAAKTAGSAAAAQRAARPADGKGSSGSTRSRSR